MHAYLNKVKSSRNLFATSEQLGEELIAKMGMNGKVLLSEPYIDHLERLILYLSYTFEAYYSNSPEHAYRALQEALLLPEIKTILTNSKRLVIGRNNNFYRIRTIEQPKGTVLPCPKIKELFHIPYELRRYITTQRYSMPGFPCLYLGSSLNVAYHEVIEAEINAPYKIPPTSEKKSYAIRLSNNYRLNCFDLSPIPLQQYVNLINDPKADIEQRISTIDKVNKYGLMWPLMAACYFQVAYKNKSKVNFKAEYIIPQLILQWFQRDINNDTDGIRYLSVNMSHQSDKPEIVGHNFVLPAKQISEKGHCIILKNSFKVTDPLDSLPYKISTLNDHANIDMMEKDLIKAKALVW